MAAAVSALDRGLTVGAGVFETLKIIDGKSFAMTRHLRRLERSAAAVGVELPPAEAIGEAAAQVLAANAAALGPLGRMRITVTAGAGELSDPYRGAGPATLLITVTPAAPWPPTTDAVVVPWTRNPDSPLAGVKSTSYAENAIALAAARAQGFSEGLFGNTRGELCEGTGSNVFVVLAGELVTPPLDSGALGGITRALVLEWVGARERAVPMSELARASEIFLTSSTRNIHPIARLGDRVLAAPGPVTTAAMATWTDRAREFDE
jgi:branched-chain amino acid aminotransferase